MKSQIKLNIIDVQLLADGSAAIITKPSQTNPSKNGVHKVNEGQLRRICLRTLGVYNPIGLKHFVTLSNGSAQLLIDAEECKSGEAFTKANGETGTYTKDWTKYNNHEIKLGVVATMKLAELSVAQSFADASSQFGVARPKAQPIEKVEAEDEKAPQV